MIIAGADWSYCPYGNGIDGGHNGTLFDDGTTGGEGNEQILSMYSNSIFKIRIEERKINLDEMICNHLNLLD